MRKVIEIITNKLTEAGQTAKFEVREYEEAEFKTLIITCTESVYLPEKALRGCSVTIATVVNNTLIYITKPIKRKKQ